MIALRRFAVALGVIAVAAIGVGAVLIGFVVATTPGAQLAGRAVERFVPGLMLERVSGTLLTGVELSGVRYATETLDAELASVTVDALWSALADRELVLRRLEVQGGRVVVRASSAPADEPLALPEIPRFVAVRRVRVSSLSVDALGTPVEVAEIVGSLDGPSIVVDTARLAVAGAAIDGNAAAELARDTARGSVEAHAALPLGASPLELEIAADIAMSTADPASAELSWSRLTLRGTPFGELVSPSGRIAVTPLAEPFGLTAAARIEGAALPDIVMLEAEGSFARGIVELRGATAATLGGEIAVRGNYDLDAQSGALAVEARALDPARLDARLAGNIGGRLDVTLDGAALDATGSAEGELNGRRLAGELRGGYENGAFELARAELALDGSRLEAAGSAANDAVNVTFSADVPDLGAWYPPASGALVMSGEARGTLADPAIRARLETSRLALAPLPRVDAVTVTLDGTQAAHVVDVVGRSAAGEVRVALEQGWDGATLRGTVRDSTLAVARAGTWNLTAPAAYSVNASRAELETACYSGPGDNRLCTTLRDDTLDVDATGLPAQLAQPWLPANIELEGAANVDLMLDWRAAPRGSLTFEQPRLAIRVADMAADGSSLEQEIVALSVRASLDASRLEAELGAAFARSAERIEGRLTLEPPNANGALGGMLTARVADLALLEAFVPSLVEPQGSVAASIELGGTPAAPELTGSVTVESFTATVPALGIDVTRATFTARGGSSDRTFALDGELCTVGCAALDGRAQLLPDGGWRMSATLRGDRIEIANLPNLHSVVAPDLALAATPAEWRVTGTVDVVDAAAVLPEQSYAAVRPAPETVVHGREESADRGGLPAPFGFEVRAQLGNVSFQGLGVTAELDGTLELRRAATGGLWVQGTTSVEEGTFRAYGQELTIERGLLIFTGPPDDPALDIRTTRVVEGSRVGLTITGTASNPRSEVFSDEALSESEAFARLLTGTSLSGASNADSDALGRAALGLGLRRVLPSLDRLGSNVGLEIGVETGGNESTDQGVLVAGRQFGDDVLLRYKHGLFEDFVALELIYRINDQLHLHTEAGTAQSIDLVYTVDQNAARALRDFVRERLPRSGAGTPPNGGPANGAPTPR